MPQGVHVRRVAHDRAEHDQVRHGRETLAFEMPGGPLAQGEPEQHQGGAADRHLRRGGRVGTALGGMSLPVHASHGPRCARERQRDGTAQVGRHELVRSDPGQQRAAQESEQQADPDAPGEPGGAAWHHRVEERRPERHRRDEHARGAAGDELLGPHDDRVAPDQQEPRRDRERAPVLRASRQPDTHQHREAAQQQPRREKPHAGEEKRRQMPHPDPDGQIGRAPDRADDEIGEERPPAEAAHVSPAPRAPRPPSRTPWSSRSSSGWRRPPPARGGCEGSARAPRATAPRPS